jgi:hypothetical protein
MGEEVELTKAKVWGRKAREWVSSFWMELDRPLSTIIT